MGVLVESRIFTFQYLPVHLWDSPNLLIQWVPGVLSLCVKWREREADHSPPTSAKVKKTWICQLPQMSSWHSA
jgi:hypothetical protein